jgi:hypothetical protein
LIGVEEQKRRLVKLYQIGEVDDAYFAEESRTLRARREALTNDLCLRPETLPVPELADLRTACERVRAWVDRAAGDDMALLGSALQLQVSAAATEAELMGIIPAEHASLYASACSDADVCAMVTKLADSSSGPAGNGGITPEI